MKPVIQKTLLFLALASTLMLSACHQESTRLPENKPAVVSPVDVFPLHKEMLAKTMLLQGELQPYEAVDVYPKIPGFIDTIDVDRGSIVRRGQTIARLTAPELDAQIAEARSKVNAVDSERAEAWAKYESDKGVYQRLKTASGIPGVISENELDTAKMTMRAAQARVQAVASSKQANMAAVRSVQHISNYLNITAPISGMVTARSLHPGALAGPSGAGASQPIVHIEQTAHLRLVVSIPEAQVANIKQGGMVHFTVSAFPDKQFLATISRISHTLDPKTRTEWVELDVPNKADQLDPGMYAQVQWIANRPEATFVVPDSAIVSTTERAFVIRVNKSGIIEWINIKRGESVDNKTEIFGDLHEGDEIVKSASDEIREGTQTRTRIVSLHF